ncbi:putative RecB family exonuclease [Streptomyces sp. Tu6071]|nr:putative RecB family exonuclease [Streptomyces sp. Tu6071]
MSVRGRRVGGHGEQRGSGVGAGGPGDGRRRERGHGGGPGGGGRVARFGGARFRTGGGPWFRGDGGPRFRTTGGRARTGAEAARSPFLALALARERLHAVPAALPLPCHRPAAREAERGGDAGHARARGPGAALRRPGRRAHGGAGHGPAPGAVGEAARGAP